MVGASRPTFSYDDYLRLAEDAPGVKFEFLNGEVWAMAGGSPRHAEITMSVGALLLAHLQGECGVYSSDLRIRGLATGLATYPDVTVVCGKREYDPADKTQHTVTNPTVLVEVLSPSTAAYDRGAKLEHYKRIASLKEIVLVAHDEARLEVWRRAGDLWTLDVFRGDQTATLRSIHDCPLPLERVFAAAE